LNITRTPDADLWEILLFGSQVFDATTNKAIIEATISFINSSKRFKTLEAFIPEAVEPP
jgi:hypothetical protein